MVAGNNNMSFFQLFKYCLRSEVGTIGDFSSEQPLNDHLFRKNVQHFLTSCGLLCLVAWSFHKVQECIQNELSVNLIVIA